MLNISTRQRSRLNLFNLKRGKLENIGISFLMELKSAQPEGLEQGWGSSLQWSGPPPSPLHPWDQKIIVIRHLEYKSWTLSWRWLVPGCPPCCQRDPSRPSCPLHALNITLYARSYLQFARDTKWLLTSPIANRTSASIYRVFFFTGPPPEKLKYGKLRLGEVMCI